jgi:hypothetical protein
LDIATSVPTSQEMESYLEKLMIREIDSKEQENMAKGLLAVGSNSALLS